MIKWASLTDPYTQLDILSLPPVAPIFPLNLEVIIANCLSTVEVILLESHQLTEVAQLGCKPSEITFTANILLESHQLTEAV